MAMKTKTPELAAPQEAYTALHPTSKTILQLLAINIDYCRPEVIRHCLNDMLITDESGRQYTLSGLRLLFDKLYAKGLLLKNFAGIACADSIRRRAFGDSLAAGTCKSFVQCLQKFLPLPTRLVGEYAGYDNYQQLLRNFQISVFFHGSLKAARDIAYQYAYADFNDEYYADNPFLAILGRPFTTEIIDKIDPAIRPEILTDLLGAAHSCLEPVDDIIAYINDAYPGKARERTHAAYLFHNYLLHGQTANFSQLLNQLPDDLQLEQVVWAGCLEVVRGDFTKAHTFFTTSSRLLKKLTGKRKVFLQNYGGIFYLLTLLQQGETAGLREALDSITIAEKNRYPLYPIMEILAPVFYDKLGMPIPERSSINLRYFLKNPLDIFFIYLFRYWAGGKTIGNDMELLELTRDKALRNGYNWLAAEFSALLTAYGIDEKNNRDTATKLHLSCNTKSCLDIVKLQPQWEKTLNALLHLSHPEKDHKKEA